MKILIDTNIIIENLTRRSGYIESLKILNLCENGTVSGIITTVTVMDVMYILRKHLNRDETRQAMQKLMLIVDVVSVLKSDIQEAFSDMLTDFEDTVQACVAARIKANYIITRNIKDFKGSKVPAILPPSFLDIIMCPNN